ncbi:MAG: winged helix-turn-helix transcriptional regulator [Candidatus Nanohalobium sp.]
MGDDSEDLRLEELEEATAFLSRKWRPLILYTLSRKGRMGFNDLKSALGDISGKVLSENLEDLREQGYVEKEVLSENPKRVRYSMTGKGRKLEPILEKMLEWAEEQKKEAEKVLIVEDEEQLSKLYSEWLSSSYRTSTANTGSEATDLMDPDVEVVLLDRALPDTTGENVAEMISSHYDPQIVFLTAKEPEVEVADMDIDDYLVKPVSAEELISKVEEMTERKEKKELKQELMALCSRKDVIEEDNPKEELEEKEKYRKLVERIETLREQVD